MTELDDMDALAAEYVLGTLTAAERADVSLRRAREPALESAIAAWERRLGPMIAVVPELPAPAHLFERIRAQIKSAGRVVGLTTREADLSRRVGVWRNATIGMTALAACLAGVIGWREPVPTPPATSTRYVALLQADKTSPGLMLSVDTEKKVFALRALSKPQERGKAYELWLVNDKLAQPKSLGLVPSDLEVRPLDGNGVDRSLFMDGTFAVSLEPEGGSPTGQPTGPVLFTGKLYQMTP